MLQFYDYDDNTTLKYESNVSSSKKEMDENLIELITLWWVKSIQKIREPIYSYDFTLIWVNWPDFYTFLNSLRINNYAIWALFPKKDFWLETKKLWYIKINSIEDDNYKSQKLDDDNRLVDVRLTFNTFDY